MKKVSTDQDRRPVSRRGVLGLGFAGTLGLPALGRADAFPDFIEQRVVESVVWAMCVDEDLFNAVKRRDYSRIEAHHHLPQRSKDLLVAICAEGAEAIATLRGVLTTEPAVGARTALGGIFEETGFKAPCPIFPCPW